MMEPWRKDSVSELGLISTKWGMVFDKVQFVQRYAPAIQKYLRALLKNEDDAEEVAQDFFLWVSKNGFPRVKQDRGRFRNYLKVAVRNAALNYVQRRRPSRAWPCNLSEVPAPPDPHSDSEHEWVRKWRLCLLNRTWRMLRRHEGRFPKNPCFTVLQLKVANPKEDSTLLSERASKVLGRSIGPEAFRKQVSRARRLFAKLLVTELAQTLDHPTPDQVTEELVDLRLLTYVRDFLPADLAHKNTLVP
jgi:DNA-directed RNA polymerase specialized sigma24 family protein